MEAKLATGDHVYEIVRLWEQLADYHESLDRFYDRSEDASAHFLTYVRQCMEVPDTAVFVCLDSEQVVGYAIASIEMHPAVVAIRPYGFIDNLVVDRKHRRMGVGTVLVSAAVDWFAKHDVTRAELAVHETNEAAIAFWKSQGFADFQKVLSRDI
jgi:ribosomal protein S18 acetylase RimI-like enzyme